MVTCGVVQFACCFPEEMNSQSDEIDSDEMDFDEIGRNLNHCLFYLNFSYASLSPLV